MYNLFIGGTLFPVPPAKIEITINGKNETLTLIDGGEINIPKTPGLNTIKFDLLLPGDQWQVASWEGGFYRKPTHYLEVLEYLMNCESFFTIDLFRERPYRVDQDKITPEQDEKQSFTVTLENYKINEDAENGYDVMVTCEFKAFKNYGTKILELGTDGATYRVVRQDKKQMLRVVEVKQNETLWEVARRENIDYNYLYQLNKSAIDNANTSDVYQVINNNEEWDRGAWVKKCNLVALVDKCFGGKKEKGDGDERIHWSHPHVMSLYHKNFLNDKDYWLTNPEAYAAVEMILALVDKASNGCYCTGAEYWAENHLESLKQKGIISESEKWENFEGTQTNKNVLALVNKALAATVGARVVYPGMLLRTTG